MGNNSMAYRHGGTPRADLDRFGLPPRPILDFSVNLNPLGPPESVREAWEGLFETIQPYPTAEGDGVSRFYQEKFQLQRAEVLPGNGSTELIYLVPRALDIQRALVVAPSYHDYERASALAGARVVRYFLSPESGFTLTDAEDLMEGMRHADAVWIGRPNNPTGTMLPQQTILDLSDRFPNTRFIIDEAFIQFVDAWEQETLLARKLRRPNVLIIHSITKFYALAGIRLGGIVGHPDLISRLRRIKEPWTVNGIADGIGPLLLRCGAYEQETRRLHSEERDRVFEQLRRVDGITPFRPCANFILCRWTRTRTLDHLLHHLLINGMTVRDCRNFPGLEGNFFRIGLRRAGENDQLIGLLSSFPDIQYA